MKINIIGHGSVGTHLSNAFSKKFSVNPVSSRTMSGLDPEADVTIIAVSDSAIDQIATQLKDLKGIVAHTSGATSIDILKSTVNRPAVIYPLQSFNKDRKMEYQSLPFFIEAASKSDLIIIKEMVSQVSSNIREANSETRKRIHLAAVFANNFTNHLFVIAQNLLKESDIDPSLITPLIRETVSRLEDSPASDVQTGPAKRGDRKTMEIHLKMLCDKPELSEIYTLLSTSIYKANNLNHD